MTRFVKPAFRALLVTGIAALAVSAPTAAAQTTDFRIQGSGSDGRCSFDSGFVTGPVAAVNACGSPGLGTEYAAVARFGAVGARASAYGFFGDSTGISFQTGSEFRDFVTFTSADPLATSALVSANLNLEGIFISLSSIDGFPNQGQTGIEVRGALGSRQFGFNIINLDFVNLGGIEGISGDLNPGDGTINGLLRTLAIQVPLGTPIDFRLSLRAGASASGIFGRPPGHVTADTNFANTFEVPIGSDAFFLQNGVTANSGTWLVNNRRIVPGAGGVPETASWALMIAGFGLVGGAARRRREAIRVAYA